MNRILITFAFLGLFAFVSADIVLVPEYTPDPPYIQNGINRANPGDTVSVWGYGEPPFTYEECVTIDKIILVVNRSFLPGQTPGHDPSWNHVHIDGEQNGSVVTFTEGLDNSAILKGFTIYNGTGFDGGGIHCFHSSPKIDSNLIRDNGLVPFETFHGGGIAIIGDQSNPDLTRPIISNNVIQNNQAGEMGGGIFYNDAHPIISNNEIVNNTVTYYAGGGIGSYYDALGTFTTEITGNTIEFNAAEEGRALFFEVSDAIVRDNKICNNTQPSPNTSAGIVSTGSTTPDFGIAFGENGPGYNIIENNGDYNISTNSILKAEGNYWSTLNTVDIVERIQGEIDFNPVAASDKWFSIETEQYCETNVLVTGILTVTLPEGFLRIAPGDTFWFQQKDNMPGLKISGGLIAESGIENMITFLPYPFWPPPTNSVWSGIDIESTAWAHFIYCKIVGAYYGIYLEDVSICEVHNCEIVDNQFAGIHVKNSSLTINGCSIMRNGVSGIEVWVNPELSRHPSIHNNNLCDNGRYGVKWENGTGALIEENIITNEITPSVDFTPSWGIYLLNVEENGEIRANEITNFVQSGICEDRSFVPIDSNFCLQNHELLKGYGYGIWCSNSSSPLVKKNTINYWKSGVHCDNNSYPNLGIFPDSGKNSILMENYYWVTNFNPEPQQYIRAELNWWGTSTPYEHPEKFIGLVDYDPWLTEPQEGGGQSADIIKPTVTFNLFPPNPNPAKGKVSIVYSLPNRCKSELIIWDVSGRMIAKINEDKESGLYSYLWNCKDQAGKEVPNGIYFVRLKAGNNLQTQKITLAR